MNLLQAFPLSIVKPCITQRFIEGWGWAVEVHRLISQQGGPCICYTQFTNSGVNISSFVRNDEIVNPLFDGGDCG